MRDVEANHKKAFSFKLFVEVFSVITAIGFLVSSLLNYAVFVHWGLNSLVLVSTSDIITSGIYISILLVPLGIVAYYWAMFVRFLWAETTYLGYVIMAIVSIPCAVYIAMVSHDIDNLDYMASYRIIVLPSLFLTVVMFVSICMESGFKEFSEKLAYYLTTAAAILTTATFIAAHRAMHGYLYGEYEVAGQDNFAGCRVMWVGDRSVVAFCPSGKFRILLGPENIHLAPLTRPSPSN